MVLLYNMIKKKWELLHKRVIESQSISKILLKNRKIKNKKEFFNPVNPSEMSLETLGIRSIDINKTLKRLKQAKKNNCPQTVFLLLLDTNHLRKFL